jgi:para-nitrobenzyl esterase
MRVASLLLALQAGCAQVAPAADGLAGTSWQLVEFRGGDGTVLTPDEGAKYTFTFGADGSFSARIDCNRGRGSWKSPAPSRLELGPMALTRAMCPPESLHDHSDGRWRDLRIRAAAPLGLFLDPGAPYRPAALPR